MTIKTQNGKVITKDGKVSCECCGLCKYFDIENLLYVAEFETSATFYPYIFYNLSAIDVGDGYQLVDDLQGVSQFFNQPDPPVVSDYRIISKSACIRFLCREVAIDGETITLETNTYIGGSTTTGKDLWEDICLPLFGNESQSGTYLYVVEFYGWYADWVQNQFGPNYNLRPRYWQSSDENGTAWKIKVTREEVA